MHTHFSKQFGLKTIVLFMSLVFCLAGCQKTEKQARTEEPSSAATAKYVFLFIGDGMGLPQRAAAESYLGRPLNIDSMPAQGITTTFANNRFITGSAASATAIACGVKTNINYIGVDSELKPVKTVSEMARDLGWKVGIVSSVSIDHATPAAFYAHVKSRSMYHEIDHALVRSGFDFFGGGGLKDPHGEKSKAPMGDVLAEARENGYKLLNDKTKFLSLKPGDGKIIAWNSWLQDDEAIPYAMDMTDNDISLPEFTAKAVEMLDNDKGFFLMVEGGKIDWACHANDAAASIRNTLAFDDAVQVALNFLARHPDETLIVVTGDHECGGLTLGFAGTSYDSHHEILSNQKVSFQKFTDEVLASFRHSGRGLDQLEQKITEIFGLKFDGDPKTDILVLDEREKGLIEQAYALSMSGEKVSGGTSEYLLYGEYDPLAVTLTHVLNAKAGLGWTSYKHTGVPVSTSAVGMGADRFNGSYDNVDVALRIMACMGLPARAEHMNAEPVKVAAR